MQAFSSNEGATHERSAIATLIISNMPELEADTGKVVPIRKSAGAGPGVSGILGNQPHHPPPQPATLAATGTRTCWQHSMIREKVTRLAGFVHPRSNTLLALLA